MNKADKIFHAATQFGSHLRDAIDIPLQVKQFKSRKAVKESGQDAQLIKTARAYDNAPNRNMDGSMSDAFKARSLANDARERTKKRSEIKY